MNTNKRILIGGGILALCAIVAILLFIKGFQKEGASVDEVASQTVSTEEPIDITLDFYDQWLEAAKSTSTDPYQSNVPNWPLLSKTLRERLGSTAGQPSGELDPVLCQNTPPERIVGRVMSKFEDSAQVLITAKDKTRPEQAIVTLKKQNEGWYISEIECAPGEFAPDREFSFEKEGHLLKSVPPPLDPQYWYVVFEENNEVGHFAPLFFDGESTCVSVEGTEVDCTLDQSHEAKLVHVYGQMTEQGVDVKKLEFME